MGALLAALALLGACGGDDSEAGADEVGLRPQTYGHGAAAADATRVVEIEMTDDFRFDPPVVEVEEGETVTFRLVNVGELPHEFTLGGPSAQEMHELQMAAMDPSDMDMGSMEPESAGEGSMDMGSMDGMEPADPETRAEIEELEEKAAAFKSVHVAPGETKELTWTFDGDEAPSFGCHIPGHFAKGMKGRVELS